MAHSYVLRGGKLKEQLAAGHFVNIGFSFFVWDAKVKTAALCFYAPQFSDKNFKLQEQAMSNRTESFQTVGVGRNADHPASLAKALDFKDLIQAKCALSIARVDGSPDNMIAALTLEAGHIILRFPLVASLSSSFPVNSRGRIFGQIQKLHSVPSVDDLEKALNPS